MKCDINYSVLLLLAVVVVLGAILWDPVRDDDLKNTWQ